MIKNIRVLTKDDLLWDPKIVDPYEIGSSIQALRKRNPLTKVGVYCGEFNDLTPADCVYLQVCRSNCDLFVVGIPTDYSIRLNKKVPRYNTKERAFRVASHVGVQNVVLYDEESCNLCIDMIDPDFIFIGRTMTDLDFYEEILQKGKIKLLEYPWRNERMEGRFFEV